jgi:hypothetical protein
MSANVGGYLRGPWWRYISKDDEKVRRCFVAAWGNIVRAPSDKYESTNITRFVIKTGRGAGRNEKHLACCAYGDRMARVIASACEKGDVVLVCGTWVEMTRKNRKDEIVPVYECHVNIMIPMGLIGFLLDLYSTPEIRQAVNRYKDGAADPFESDDNDDYGF